MRNTVAGRYRHSRGVAGSYAQMVRDSGNLKRKTKVLSLQQNQFVQQLVLDIPSDGDADLIKELLKRFKGVEVNNFTTTLTTRQIQQRINEGLKQANEGDVKLWKEVKAGLLKRIKSKQQ